MIDNWPEEEYVLTMLEKLPEEERELIKFLMLCYPVKESVMSKLFSEAGLRFIIDSGLATYEDGLLRPSGYAILPVKGLYLIVRAREARRCARREFHSGMGRW